VKLANKDLEFVARTELALLFMSARDELKRDILIVFMTPLSVTETLMAMLVLEIFALPVSPGATYCTVAGAVVSFTRIEILDESDTVEFVVVTVML